MSRIKTLGDPRVRFYTVRFETWNIGLGNVLLLVLELVNLVPVLNFALVLRKHIWKPICPQGKSNA